MAYKNYRAVADQAVVQQWMEHLLKAHTDFADQHPDVKYVDALMAVHNFHAVIAIEIANDSGNRNELLKVALDTFTNRIRQELEKE